MAAGFRVGPHVMYYRKSNLHSALFNTIQTKIANLRLTNKFNTQTFKYLCVEQRKRKSDHSDLKINEPAPF